MDTLIRTQQITAARDLKPGDVITQEYEDGEIYASRGIRLDRVLSSYIPYTYGGRVYLVPVITVHGWDVHRGRGVLLTCTPTRAWDTVRNT
jgi:hypothetical protein